MRLESVTRVRPLSAAEAGRVPEVRFVQDLPPRDPQNEVMTTTHDTTTKAAVIPVLVYEDIEAAHDFLVGTFGFTSGGLHRLDDGTVVHAEVRNGDAAIWLHRVSPEHDLASPRGAGPCHTGACRSSSPRSTRTTPARRRPAHASTSAPTDQDYGLREYGARDPENHRWWFSSPLA